MWASDPAKDNSSFLLDHRLTPYLRGFSRVSSTRALHSLPLYQRLRPEIERLFLTVVKETLDSSPVDCPSSLRVTAWNIERGIQLERIIHVLQSHPEIRKSDLFLLTELDLGMARTSNRFVAREIAQALRLNYVFVPCYLSLVKGSGLESRAAGENFQSIHGNALFSRYPIREAHSLALPNGKDKMGGSEKRLGCQRAVVALIDHPRGRVRAVSLHLDAHSSQRHRYRQMKLVLDYLGELEPSLPVVIGGDWNTSTYNSSSAFLCIVGYCRRVLMGVHNMLENHYPHPDRWFERHLFRELERRGYRYRDLNEPGVCTLHYDVGNRAVNSNMAEWIPGWCFWFIDWALRKNGGSCSLKLDWFAGKGIAPNPDFPPKVVGDIQVPDKPLSDHDPIVLDFLLEK